MKTIQLIAAFLFLAAGINAQTKSTVAVKTSTFKVWGNCGMCKKNIEGAAKTSGASFANWNVNTKMLTVKYAASKTSVDKIQKGIANAGYDNITYAGNDEAYNNLDKCCQYDRKSAVSTKGEKGEKGDKGSKDACCMKDGKCTGDKECCKKMEGKADCCAAGACGKEGGCCAAMKCEKGEGCCKKDGVAKSDCCKGEEGKCSHH
ncbi:MAG: hypothetical protein K2X48_09290 [Chitinophagaceae bacterium]|nr:hypothetical protein [Chitinophagaceae bacterium]